MLSKFLEQKQFQQSIKQYYPATPVVPNSGFPVVKRAVSESGGSPKYLKKWLFPPLQYSSWPQLEKFDIMMQTTGFVSLVYQLWDWPTAEGTAALINKHNFPANIHYKYLSIYKYLPVQYKYLI